MFIENISGEPLEFYYGTSRVHLQPFGFMELENIDLSRTADIARLIHLDLLAIVSDEDLIEYSFNESLGPRKIEKSPATTSVFEKVKFKGK